MNTEIRQLCQLSIQTFEGLFQQTARPLLSLTDDDVLVAAKLAKAKAGQAKLTAEHFSLAADEVKGPSAKTVIKRKVARPSGKTIKEALRLTLLAEKAVKADDKTTLLQALADLQACLTGKAVPQNENVGINTRTFALQPEPIQGPSETVPSGAQ